MDGNGKRQRHRAVGSQRLARRGFTITEVVVAMVLLTVAIALVAQTVAAVGRQSLVVQRKATAIQEAANLLEQTLAVPWDELTEENVAKRQPSDPFRQRFPAALVQVTVTPTEDPGRGKRVRVEIRWPDRNGRRIEPVRLTAWRFAVEESEP
jgi:prepilin-type N-terminal cleavage/methylation domain-containing protein